MESTSADSTHLASGEEPTQAQQQKVTPYGDIVTILPEKSDAEITSLARLLSGEFKRRLDHFTSQKNREEYPLRTTQDHVEFANPTASPEFVEQQVQTPSEEVTWYGMTEIYNHNPELFLRKWEEIKEEARQELALGLRAEDAANPEKSPWTRAQFIALRQDFAEEWNPRGGIEWNLIDQMANAYSMFLYWQKIMLRWMDIHDNTNKGKDTWDEESASCHGL